MLKADMRSLECGVLIVGRSVEMWFIVYSSPIVKVAVGHYWVGKVSCQTMGSGGTNNNKVETNKLKGAPALKSVHIGNAKAASYVSPYELEKHRTSIRSSNIAAERLREKWTYHVGD